MSQQELIVFGYKTHIGEHTVSLKMLRLVLAVCVSAVFVTANPLTKARLCQVCNDAVKDLHAVVSSEKLHAEMMGKLEAVCSMVATERIDICSEVISSLSQEMLYKFPSDTNANDICISMTVCPDSGEQPPVRGEPNVHIVQPPEQPARVNNITCELCEFLIQTVDRLTKNKTSPAEANATAYKVCETLPEPIRDTCVTFIPLIVDMIINGVDPVGACTNIGVCLDEPVISIHRSLQLKEPVSNSIEGPACSLCELLVQTIDTYLQKNRSEAAINATVYKLCNDLPGTLKDTCLAFAPQLVAALAKGVDPQKACTTIHLCTSTDLPMPTLVEKVEGPACTLCELLVQTIDTYLQNNHSEAAINSTVYKLCNDLPGGLKDMCLGFAPQLVAALAKGVDPQKACTTIHLCTSTAALPVPDLKETPEGPACSLCELLVQTIDTYLQKNRSEAAINATVYKLCNDLPGTLKDTCLAFAPQLVAVLAKGVDPQKACTTIHLCTNPDEIPVDLGLPVLENIEGPACSLCELLVQTIDTYLQKNRSEAAINATVYKLCNDLPGGLKDTCLAFAPQLVAVLAKGVDPQKACTTIHLCTTEEVPVLSTQDNPEGPACGLCELLVQTIDTYLQKNRSEAAINATVYKLCNDLPGGLKDTCLAFAPQLVAVLSKGVDPQKACTTIHLCTTAEIAVPSTKDNPEGPACTLCELLVQTIDTYLQKNRSEAAINATVYKLCNDLPGTLKNTCLAFAPQLVAALAKGVDPQKACTTIHLCTSTEIPVSVPKDIDNGPACELCELLVQTIDAYLQNNHSEAAINATVYKLCNDFTGSIKFTCLAFSPQLVAVLAKGVDPKKACTTIKICTNSTGTDLSVPERMFESGVSGAACELCELLVQTIDTYLQKNRSEAAINATVYKLCNDLPGGLKDTCLAFAPQLVAVLAKGVDPKKACTTIHLCTGATEKETYTKEIQLAVSGPACELCELLVQTIDTYLQKNRSEAAINATVYKLCNDLPGTLKDTCIAFAPQLVAVLAKGVDPQKACTTIHLCISTEAQGPLSSLLLNPAAVSVDEGMWCTICKDHIEILDRDLYKDEGQVQSFLEGICHRLSPPTDQACLTFADNNFPEIYEKILNGTASAQHICSLLKACP